MVMAVEMRVRNRMAPLHGLYTVLTEGLGVDGDSE